MKSLDYVSLAPNITFQSDDPKSVCLIMMKHVEIVQKASLTLV